jgi:folate-dependent phosphoribosylglycinamide formyltransferase PurN
LRRRVEKLGVVSVLGQLAFRSVVVPQLARASRQRIRGICDAHGLVRAPIAEPFIERVPSVNSEDARRALRALSPRVVVVNGTRIISSETLASVGVPFVNTHAGITPLYRGVHGAYWALATEDRAHCGVTVHLVDRGIDTGGILGQAPISPTPADNFVTYPYLQYAAALPLLRRAITDLLEGKVELRPAPAGASRLWSHPTLSEYLRNRRLRGAR